MNLDQTYQWLVQSERRKNVIIGFNQPLTATHIAQRVGLSLDACLNQIWGLTLYRVIYCLNKDTKHSRLYWLTELGKNCQLKLRKKHKLQILNYTFPDIPWDVFSSVCYSHRSAVIKAMFVPMQPAEIKRKAYLQDRALRMSANNVRDVMKYLLKNEIVCKVMIRRKSHPRYELTDQGKLFRELLVEARAVC